MFRDRWSATDGDERAAIERFGELYEALCPLEGWLARDHLAMRYGAVALLRAEGAPAELAAQTSRVGERFERKTVRWFRMSRPLRTVIAALMVRGGLDVDEVSDDVAKIRGELRPHRIGGWFESPQTAVVAAVAIRLQHGCDATQGHVLDRVGDIYREMRKRSLFLTDLRDAPACALLATLSEPAAATAERADKIYDALRKGTWIFGSNQLQHAANLLAYCQANPQDAAARFSALATALRGSGFRAFESRYDEIAQLCYLNVPGNVVATHFVKAHRAVEKRMRWSLSTVRRFELTTALTFESLRSGEGQALISITKALIDGTEIAADRANAATVTTGGH